jgi:NAD(P)-dependent dehydrogenase (short-subunit alcohol dehydrogenase family)
MTTHQRKIAIVTGGRQGIGRGVADLLAQRGAMVVIVNRVEAPDVAEAIGNGAISLAADVTNEADWAAVARRVEERFGRVDILVHAAGIYPVATLDAMTLEEWRRVMGVNPRRTSPRRACDRPAHA